MNKNSFVLVYTLALIYCATTTFISLQPYLNLNNYPASFGLNDFDYVVIRPSVGSLVQNRNGNIYS